MICAFLRVAIDLLYPRRAVCAACGSRLGLDRDDVCEICRQALAEDWVGVRAVNMKKTHLSGAAFAHRYHGAAGGMVRSLKYRSVRTIGEGMAQDVARAAKLLSLRDPRAVTTVPMHTLRLNTRGFNHAEVLARAAARELGLPYRDLLYRTRNAPQQARLDAKARMVNLRGAFAVREEMRPFVSGGTFLLIDDVWTTGATAINCALALKVAGAAHVYFAAYATGERKHTHGKNNQRKESDRS